MVILFTFLLFLCKFVLVTSVSTCALGSSDDYNDWIADASGRLNFPVIYNDIQVNTKTQNLCDEEKFQVYGEDGNGCSYDDVTGKSFCRGQINSLYIDSIRNETIRYFIVTDYDSTAISPSSNPTFYDKDNSASGLLVNGSNVVVVRNENYKLAGQVFSPDIGLGIKLSTQITHVNYFSGYVISGDVYSNELRLGWKIDGKLYILFISGRTVLKIYGCETAKTWCVDLSATLLNPQNAEKTWNISGSIQGDANFGTMPFLAVIVSNEDTGWEAKGTGLVESNIMNLSIEGSICPNEPNPITIPESLFLDMSINHMYFSDSVFVGNFDERVFKGINELKTITFTNSIIEDLPTIADLLYNIPTLQALYIEKSSIPNFSFGVNASVPNMEYLSLKGSGPLDLESSSFLWLQNSQLTYLNLQDCNINIQSTAELILQPVNKTLRYLDLSYASITDEQSLYKLLEFLNLTHLSLAGLELTKIPKKALSGTSDSLQYLTLRGNKLQKVPDENIFLYTLEFPSMPNLLELDLSNCGINFIEHGSFDNFPMLKKLYLSGNAIDNIQDGWVKVAPSINYIDLSRNGKNAGAKSYNTLELTNQDRFSNLNQLEILDLSNGVFSNPDSVMTTINNQIIGLSICNTGLKNITNFQIFDKLVVLDLSNNPLILYTTLETINFFSTLVSLEYLHLRNNKITNTFFSAINSYTNETPKQYFLKRLKVLDLKGNNIKTLTDETFKSFPGLETLDLSGNSITVWSSPFTINMPNLKNLKISDNKIEGLTSSVIAVIKNLTSVELSKNPFTCNCDVAKFNEIMKGGNGAYCWGTSNKKKSTAVFRFNRKPRSANYETDNLELLLQTENNFLHNKQKICSSNLIPNDCVYLSDWENQSDYYCYEPNSDNIKKLRDYNVTASECVLRDLAETTHQGLSTIYITMAVLVSLALFCGLIYWKFWDIRLITRAVRNAVALATLERDKPLLRNTFEYFAFVSYSDKDRPWVINDLLPKLDMWNNLRICLHERDFQVGTSILENISNCMDTSQNILLILSQSFLKSQWCQFEMHFAQHRLLETKQDNLVIILLEPIPKYKRPKILNYLLRTQTYIEWPEKSLDVKTFWNRLFKALSLNPCESV